MLSYRSSGILLPVFSLPGPYGIGTLGAGARRFVDFLSDAGQHYWQILPLVPPGGGDSPYMSPSSFAGNPLLLDLDALAEEELLTPEELESAKWPDPDRVDYTWLHATRPALLRKAWERGRDKYAKELEQFLADEALWLPDFAFFLALRDHFGGAKLESWPHAVRTRQSEALSPLREELADEIEYHAFLQLLFFRQWEALKEYANDHGVRIIGDLPIYVSPDSAEVWGEPGLFQVDEDYRPSAVAGVPPDAFSADGQLWGNPLYDWDAMKRDGYQWWIRRIEGAARLYDILRIDHFRGLESYWAVPYGETTAKNGRWVKGPGMDLLRVLTGRFPNIQFIAEDLGFLTPEVRQLLEDSGFPGMKVLEFAFDSREPSNYLPHTYTPHCVCYAGTHDNAPLMIWKDEADPADIAMARRYLGLNESEGFHWGVLRGGLSSVAELFVAQMQDYLGLGAGSRMNTPGTLGGNWQWRLLPGQITAELTEKIREAARLYGRA